MVNSITTKNEELTIRITIGGSIGVHKAVLRVLNSPKHLNFWWSERENALLVSASQEKTDLSVEVPSYIYVHKNGMMFRNKKLNIAICDLVKCSHKVVCRLNGEFIPELNMVAFRLDGAGGVA